MSIVGKWKMKAVSVPVLDGDNWTDKLMSVEELAASDDENMQEYAQFAACITEFAPDNSLVQWIPLSSPEMEEEAKNAGVEIIDGYAKIDVKENAWKEENGAFYVKIGEGSIGDGPEQDLYEPIKIQDDGCIWHINQLLEKA